MLRRLAEQGSYAALQEACLSAGAGTPPFQVLLALADARLGNACAARRALESIEDDSLDTDARVDLAAVHLALGDLDEAIAILEGARREAPGHALLLARLAWCRMQQGDREEALGLYERSLSLEPRITAFHELMRLYRQSGRIDDMARCLDAAREFWLDERGNWPLDLNRRHERALRHRQFELLLDRSGGAAADAWIDQQRESLDGTDWCDLLCHAARELAALDRHPEAEEWIRVGLQHHPDHLELHLQLAELARSQGRVRQAAALLRRTIRLAEAQREPTDLLWARLSMITLHANPGLARVAADRAHAELSVPEGECERDLAGNVGRRRQIELALAGVEAAEENFDDAEWRYRSLIDQDPRQVAALQGLGQLLMQTGRIEEAATLFERMTAIDPARGHSALINARRFPGDDETLHRLEGLARTPGTDSAVRTGLLFNLAAAWEKRGDYDKAFALADEANAASRRLLRYDPEAHRQRCARIRHAFPRALFEHRRDCGHESSLPVFVVGMPRSGTTLVEQILAGHSRIHGAGELGVIPRVVAGLERWERRTGSGRHYPDCVDDLDPAVTRGIAESVLSELREYAPDADHVVDKLPHNFENVGLIKLLFPQARIISVRRDPRDIAVSNYFTDYAAKHAGMGFAYDLDWIGEQLADHKLLLHHRQQVFPGEIQEIRYEDVVDDPEATARRMLDYIGVAWEPRTLDFAALERPVRTASVWQVRQPLYTSSKARWRRYADHLAPLIAATNRRISWQPIEMVTLPEPGWLSDGVDRYREGDLDAAEYRFRLLLQHLPEHAAARFMLGLIHVDKGHSDDGIALMTQALERCPWNRLWRDDLIRACELNGRMDDAAALAQERATVSAPAEVPTGRETPGDHLDYLYLSGESACPSSGFETTRASC